MKTDDVDTAADVPDGWSLAKLLVAAAIGVMVALMWLETGGVSAAESFSESTALPDCTSRGVMRTHATLADCLVKRVVWYALDAEKVAPGDQTFAVPPEVGTTIYVEVQVQ